MHIRVGFDNSALNLAIRGLHDDPDCYSCNVFDSPIHILTVCPENEEDRYEFINKLIVLMGNEFYNKFQFEHIVFSTPNVERELR